MLPTRTVSYKDETYDLEIIVKQVTAREGIKRTVLQQQARKAQPTDETVGGLAPDAEDAGIALLAWQSLALGSYPSCLSATASIRSKDEAKVSLNLDLGLEEFMSLPETLIELWESAVQELNPQWYRFLQQGNASKPDEGTASTGNSTPGSSRTKRGTRSTKSGT